MVEGLREDPYGLDVLIGRQVLVAEHQHLVVPERPAQRVGGGVVDGAGQVDTGHLGAEAGAGAVDAGARVVGGVVAGHSGRGHAHLLVVGVRET